MTQGTHVTSQSQGGWTATGLVGQPVATAAPLPHLRGGEAGRGRPTSEPHASQGHQTLRSPPCHPPLFSSPHHGLSMWTVSQGLGGTQVGEGAPRSTTLHMNLGCLWAAWAHSPSLPPAACSLACLRRRSGEKGSRDFLRSHREKQPVDLGLPQRTVWGTSNPLSQVAGTSQARDGGPQGMRTYPSSNSQL